MFDLGGKRLSFLVGNLGIVFAQAFQDEVGDIFYLVFPFLFAANIINLTRLKIINDIGKGAAGILNIIEDAPVTEIDGVRLIFEHFVDEGRDDAPIRAVVFMGSVGINRSDPYRLSAKHSL